MEAQVGVLEAGALRGEVADEHTLAHEVREQRGRGGLTPQLHHDAVPTLARAGAGGRGDGEAAGLEGADEGVPGRRVGTPSSCLLYTSDAADE